MQADLSAEHVEQVAQRCRANGVGVEVVLGDVGEEDVAARIVGHCVRTFGGIGILVNNAWMLTQSRCVDMLVEIWDDSVYAVKARDLTCSSSAGVVNVASQLGIKGAWSLATIARIRDGSEIIDSNESLALETAAMNVLVNAIAPHLAQLKHHWWRGSAQIGKRQSRLNCSSGTSVDLKKSQPTAPLLAFDQDGNLCVGQTLGPNLGDVML